MADLDYIKSFCSNKNAVTKDSKVQCCECMKYIAIEDWEEFSAECELCGDHSALICPECDEIIDSMYAPLLRNKL